MRLSGPEAGHTLGAITRAQLPLPRQAVVRTLRDPGTGETLDQALVLWLPGPGSFTGEDVVELHIHGGVAVRAAVVRTLAAIPGCRAAEPGEFTRRAVLSGRMDLSAAEGLADLIDAETEAQRRQAFRQVEGVLAGEVARWRERLVEVSGLVEAALDFSDQEDVSPELTNAAQGIFREVGREIADAVKATAGAERLRDGFVAVIAGSPNAGKSTLLNAIARREVAIVSPEAGTTRDAIEVRCDLGGLPVTFVDTAGLRNTDDPVERIGVERARGHARSADLVLWLRAPGEADGEGVATVAPVIRVRTKADLTSLSGETPGEVAVSAVTGVGLDRLLAAVTGRAEAAVSGAADAVVVRERHRVALTDVAECLARAGVALATGAEELAAEDVRLALRALGRITGTVDVEEVLDRVFTRFCIGK